MTPGKELAEAIQERYADCAVLPRGTQTALALEFGVSRERARQIAVALGKRGTLRVPRRPCASCGEPLPKGSKVTICRECKWIDVACGDCGKMVRRLASTLAWNVGNAKSNPVPSGKVATYTGRIFCDRKCFGSWSARDHGFIAHPENARISRPKPIRHGTQYAYVRRKCRCDECRVAYKTANQAKRQREKKRLAELAGA